MKMACVFIFYIIHSDLGSLRTILSFLCSVTISGVFKSTFGKCFLNLIKVIFITVLGGALLKDNVNNVSDFRELCFESILGPKATPFTPVCHTDLHFKTVQAHPAE